jgi:hypothetical protein
MNIFALHTCPIRAAEMLCDDHCKKMLIENCQMFANCFTSERLAANDCPRTQKGTVRKYSYYNHPCSKWLREGQSNMKWLLDHSFAIETERLFRGYNPHFSMCFIQWVQKNFFDTVVPHGKQTPFSLAMPEQYKTSCPIQSYRNYYIGEKSHIFNWTKRPIPDWI